MTYLLLWITKFTLSHFTTVTVATLLTFLLWLCYGSGDASLMEAASLGGCVCRQRLFFSFGCHNLNNNQPPYKKVCHPSRQLETVPAKSSPTQTTMEDLINNATTKKQLDTAITKIWDDLGEIKHSSHHSYRKPSTSHGGLQN